MPKEPEMFCPTSRQHWREWLHTHHAHHAGIWLVYYRKSAGQPTITVSEGVDEALCFGWINGQAKPLDDTRYLQFYCRRRPRSGWSKVNKDKIERLVSDGQMTQAGFDCIEAARQNNSWALLDEVETLTVPPDLADALHRRPPAARYFAGLSCTDRRNLLQWLVLARLPATRQRRIGTIADLAAQQQKPPQFGAPKKAAR